jgi:hypothetical protein
MDLINRLSNKIDQYGYGNEWGSGLDVKDNLWTDLDNLRNSNIKNNLINDWKYKTDLQTTEIMHMNGKKTFNSMNWESSFVLTLLCCIYH